MSAETLLWLNQNTKVGYTDPIYGRGMAWHYRADLQNTEKPNHYPHAIPVADVISDLFYWKALEAELVVRTADGRESVDTSRKAIVRGDDPSTVFGVFKSSYTVHQYEEWLLKQVSNLVDDSDLAIGTAGLLRNGGKAFVTIELPETVKTPMGFDIRPHLLACTSHDGTLSTTYQLVSTIVVCDNTLAGALGEQTPQHKVRHSKNSIGKLQTVRDALTLVHEYSDSLTAELERLSSQAVTDQQFQSIVERLVPVDLSMDVRPQVKARVENKQELLRHIYKNDSRVSPWSGTALGVYQAWNTFQHHYAGKDTNRVERNMLNGVMGKTKEQDDLVLTAMRAVLA